MRRRLQRAGKMPRARIQQQIQLVHRVMRPDGRHGHFRVRCDAHVQQALYRHPAVRDHHTRTLLPAFSAAPGSSCPWLVCAWCKDVLPSSQHVVVHTCSRVSSKAASSMPCPTGARACRAAQWPQGCIAQRMAVRCSARCMLCPSCACSPAHCHAGAVLQPWPAADTAVLNQRLGTARQQHAEPHVLLRRRLGERAA